MKTAFFIDAHCHLADPRLDSTRDEVLDRSRSAGIHAWVQAGIGPEDWERQQSLKTLYGDSWISNFGLHPWWIAKRNKDEVLEALESLQKLLLYSTGLGELGLDFSKRFRKSSHALQIMAFEAQLDMAIRMNKPLILHIVHAHEEALIRLHRKGIPAAGGMVHSFSANAQIAKRYLDLGLSLSISGAITRAGFEALKSSIASIPSRSMLLETDSPDQPPDGWDQPLNEPISLLQVAQVISELKRRNPDSILRECAENTERLFQLDFYH